MIHDQADGLRALARIAARPDYSLAPPPRMIATSSGKEGIGATTIAFNLAVALARLGNRTVWIDADLERGGASPWRRTDDRGSLADVLAGRRTIHEALDLGPAGIQVLSGAWTPSALAAPSPAAQTRFLDELHRLGLHADVVLLDLGSARSDFARRFWKTADLVLLLGAADPAGVMESYAAIKSLLDGETQTPLSLGFNFATAEEAADAHARIAGACRKFLGVTLPEPLHLAEDSAIATATAAGRSFVWPSLGGASAEQIELWAETLWSRMRDARADAGRRAA
jgi:flagellar biosynthesis protein FlhG